MVLKCVRVCAHMCVHACTHVCSHVLHYVFEKGGQILPLSVFYFFLPYFAEEDFPRMLSWPFDETGWPGPGDLLVSHFPQGLGCRCSWVHLGNGDMNPGPHTYTVSSLQTELSPQPTIYKNMLKRHST